MIRKKIVAGNWKMNGSLAANASLLSELAVFADSAADVEVVVFPPFPYLVQAATVAQGSILKLGAQTLSEHASGAYTGEISGRMLKDLGCDYVLVGHSERRSMFGENNRIVAEKFKAAIDADLIPVLCVGETLVQRESGGFLEVIESQLQSVFDCSGVESLAHAVVAYEPVWAIGTGRTASPEQAQEVHVAIRQIVARKSAVVADGLRILYGGSVKADNAAAIFGQADIDGGLVGGASLKAVDFIPICRSVSTG